MEIYGLKCGKCAGNREIWEDENEKRSIKRSIKRKYDDIAGN